MKRGSGFFHCGKNPDASFRLVSENLSVFKIFFDCYQCEVLATHAGSNHYPRTLMNEARTILLLCGLQGRSESDKTGNFFNSSRLIKLVNNHQIQNLLNYSGFLRYTFPYLHSKDCFGPVPGFAFTQEWKFFSSPSVNFTSRLEYMVP